MKYLALIALCLAGCKTHTTMCLDMAQAQYADSCRRLGPENAQLWQLKNANPIKFIYHRQARERVKGVWYWIPNGPYTVFVSPDPQDGCIPDKMLRGTK